MKVAVSVTKVFEVGDMTLEELRRRMEDLDEDDEDEIDWYDIEITKREYEIWSYAIVKEV